LACMLNNLRVKWMKWYIWSPKSPNRRSLCIYPWLWLALYRGCINFFFFRDVTFGHVTSVSHATSIISNGTFYTTTIVRKKCGDALPGMRRAYFRKWRHFRSRDFMWRHFRSGPLQYQSWYLTPCCGLELHYPTKALTSIKGSGNIFDINVRW
jgi:hypothetical protein